VVGNIDEIRFDQREGQNHRVSPPHLYTVLGTEALFDINVLVKMRGDASAVSGQLRKAVASIDPTIPVEQAGALADFLAEPFSRERLIAAVVIAFGLLAMAITATGIYAVVAYGAARRTREMGIRLALGARKFDILALGMRRALLLSGAGAAIGVASAIGTTRWLGHYLFEVSPVQPAALAGAIIVMLGAALIASGIPAYRATRVDPMTSLRRD
jgi:ABC-type antimicrobial peptide transport system permease subunit